MKQAWALSASPMAMARNPGLEILADQVASSMEQHARSAGLSQRSALTSAP